MKLLRCLYCYQELVEEGKDFHPSCSRKIFNKPAPPELPYSEEQMQELAEQVIRSQVTVTGVQPKLSLDIQKDSTARTAQRFTIVGLWGRYILKPPTKHYAHLPEVEDLTMHLAEICSIRTVPHSLIQLSSGSLAYITKRVDRQNNGGKLHMEDMCQLTERLTEDKYHGSYEQIAKAILTYSATPGLDVVNYYEQVLFSFLTGNADMHLKNFSLLKTPELGYTLVPAYDMVASALVNKEDKEELALTLNGKKRNITRNDFTTALRRAGITEKVQMSLFGKFEKAIAAWKKFIEMSFLPPAMQEEYKTLIRTKATQAGLEVSE